MIRLIILLGFILTNVSINAQFSRDSVIGIYDCNMYEDGNPNIWKDTLVVVKNGGNNDQIYISATKVIPWSQMITLDSVTGAFTENNFPNLEYGAFFLNDSIYYRRWLFNSSTPFIQWYEGYKFSIVNSIERIANKNDFSIFPNPANSFITISLQMNTTNAELKITNIIGEIVLQKTINTQNTKIDVSDFQSGVYFLSIKINEGILTKKVIVQR